MRRGLLIAGAIVVGVLALGWMLGWSDRVMAWAVEGQRQFQNALARGLRAVKAGEPGALGSLLTVCFAYGFFHAAGPGHGKMLVGGYGVARRVAAMRLAGIALAASLAQALTAVALVGAGVLVFDLTREAMTDLADVWLERASYAAIGLIGIWLFWRGVRALRLAQPAHSHDDHHHHHDHDHSGGTCSQCGHAHGPTPEQAAQVHSLREALILVAGIAIRPCTGALFVLILCWRFGIFGAGVLGALTMGLGTATVTVTAALGSVLLREGILAGGGTLAHRLAPVLQIAAGALIALSAAALVWR